MRRILNLNQPGVVFLKIIGLFMIVIPAVLYGGLLLLNDEEIIHTLRSLIRISFAIGAFTFVLLFVLIIAEQIQDRRIDIHYQENRDRRLPLADGYYECQYCGNQKIKVHDKTCLVCGKELK